jgi:hypothetical protein
VERLTFESKQFQRALHFPIENSNLLNNISIRYYMHFIQIRPPKPYKCDVCIIWNILDTLIYAIIPFIIILISSIIIIIKICQRRRSTVNFGGMCHMNRHTIARQDNLSMLLIIINCLFLLMTGPLNICLIMQPIFRHFSLKFFLQSNQYLRLLQNSYHALSFIFYCIIGKKFRKTAWSIGERIYCKLFQLIFRYPPNESSMVSSGLQQNNRLTTSTSTNDNIKRLSINFTKKQNFVTIASNEKRRKTLSTYV